MFRKLFGSGKKLEKTGGKKNAEFLKRLAAGDVTAGTTDEDGNKKPNPPISNIGGAAPPTPGHAAVLRRLQEAAQTDPVKRLEMIADFLVQDAVSMVKNLGGREGVRVEDLLALLGSAAGFSVIWSALGFLETMEAADRAKAVHHIKTADGRSFYVGELQNHILNASEMPPLGLALGMVRELGGEVSVQMVEDAIGHCAATLGTEAFGVPRLPENHRPIIAPIAFVEALWPRIDRLLEMYQVDSLHKPSVIGIAIQKAIVMGKSVLDPTVAGQIIVECAVPMSRLDLAEVQFGTAKADDPS